MKTTYKNEVTWLNFSRVSLGPSSKEDSGESLVNSVEFSYVTLDQNGILVIDNHSRNLRCSFMAMLRLEIIHQHTFLMFNLLPRPFLINKIYLIISLV